MPHGKQTELDKRAIKRHCFDVADGTTPAAPEQVSLVSSVSSMGGAVALPPEPLSILNEMSRLLSAEPKHDDAKKAAAALMKLATMDHKEERDRALSFGVHTTVVLVMVDWNSSDKVLPTGLACL